MRNKILIFLVMLSVVEAAVLVPGYFLYKTAVSKADRMEANYMAGQGNNVNVVNLTSEEFKAVLKANNDSLLQRVSDTLNFKTRARNIDQVNNYEYNYYDTTPSTIPLIKVNNLYPFKVDSGCWGVEGIINIEREEMTITKKKFEDNIIDVNGGKCALRMKWLFGGIRIGRREPFNVTLSNCGGVITKKQINVIK